MLQVASTVLLWRPSRSSQLNCGTWVVMLLSGKSCALTVGYNFWPSDKHLIQQLISESSYELNPKWGNYLGGDFAGCTIVLWHRLGGSSHNQKFDS